MANPTACDANPVVILVPNASEAEVALNPLRQYIIHHDSVTDAGAGDANCVFFSFGGTVDNDHSEGDDKGKLVSGATLWIGPGVKTFKMRTAAGTPTVTIVPRDIGHY